MWINLLVDENGLDRYAISISLILSHSNPIKSMQYEHSRIYYKILNSNFAAEISWTLS